jgi:hypothetical protein
MLGVFSWCFLLEDFFMKQGNFLIVVLRMCVLNYKKSPAISNKIAKKICRFANLDYRSAIARVAGAISKEQAHRDFYSSVDAHSLVASVDLCLESTNGAGRSPPTQLKV